MLSSEISGGDVLMKRLRHAVVSLGLCSGCGSGAWLVGILVATVILGGHEYVHHVPHIDFMPLLLLLH